MTDTPEDAPAADNLADAPAADAPLADVPAADTPPDRLSVDPRSPWFDGVALGRGIGIMFKGVERFNVEEYCVSEGWVRLAMPRAKDRRGNQLTMKLQGPVAPYFKHAAAPEEQAE